MQSKRKLNHNNVNSKQRFGAKIHKVSDLYKAVSDYKHKLFKFWRQISVLSLHYCGLIFVLIALLLSKSARELSVTVCLLLFRKRNSEIDPLFDLKEKHQNSKSLCL